MEWKHVGSRKRNKNSTPDSYSTQFISPFQDHNNNPIQTPININHEPKQEQSKLKSKSQKMSIFLASSSCSSTTAPDLPCSIMIDILSRLPIRTLMQCSYVCKSWHNLLSESYFYRLFSSHTPTTLILQVKGTSLDSLREIHLIEPSSAPSSLTSKMKLLSNNNVKAKEKLRQELNWVVPNFRFQLGNGCNGLICLREIRTREPRLVWNPIMGQFVVLPKPVLVSDNKVVAGFGFCNRTNRYKVVRIFHAEFDPPLKRRVEIYDLGVGNEWRKIEGSPLAIPSRIPGFYSNCCLHWIVDSSELICCFDFVEEVFSSVAAPPIFSSHQRNKYHWSNLGILGGSCLSICAIDAKIFRPDVQVWVMEEYGVPESWALRLSIRDPTVDWWDPYRWIQVTNFLRNGEILMLCGHCYVLAYDVRERRFRSVEGLDFPAIAHVPSFISLEDVLRDDLGTGSLIVRYL